MVPRYVIITPAYNEEALIRRTIESVIAQTQRPAKWVIVNDASTDRTGQIVAQYLTDNPFIQLVNVDRPSGRHFGNKARAFHRGFAETGQIDFDYVGNLDADISIGPTYFEELLREFERDPRLGIGGGMVSTCIDGAYVSQEVALDSVAGAVQLFRPACFNEIGGYMSLPHGGIDTAAEILARMKGWRVRTFPHLQAQEHRRTGTAAASPWMARIKEGKRFYSLGYGFLFYCARCLYRSMERPRVVGSILAFMGYVGSWLKREQIALPPDVVQHLRAEQRRRLFRPWSRLSVENSCPT